MRKLAFPIVLLLLAVLLVGVLASCEKKDEPSAAAVAAPGWVSTEAQTRLRQWFRIDERDALYTLVGDLTDAGGFWSTLGNAGTTAGTHFVGTTDAQNVVFKRNSVTVGTFTAAGFDMLNSLIFENDETISNENDGELAITTPNIWIGDDHTIVTGSAGSGILSGDNDTLYAKWSVIAGGTGNTITATAIADDARYSFLGGGQNNEINITGDYGTLVGGVSNVITGTGSYDFLGAGYNNEISSADSAVLVGGAENIVSGSHSAVLGGYDNLITSTYAMAFGRDTDTTADYCVTLGRRAKCTLPGSFVFADSTDADYTSALTDSFHVRADYMVLDADVVPQAGFQIYPENATNTSAQFDCYADIVYSTEVSQTVCVLPANVNIIDILFVVTTQFNDSGTDTMDCGISPAADPDDYVDALDVATAGVNRMGDAGDMPYGEFGDVGGSDVTVVCKYDGQNDNASAGAGTIVIVYVVD